MSRPYNPDCEIERENRALLQRSPYGIDFCGKYSPGYGFSCARPRGHDGIHLSSRDGGNEINIRWTDDGIIQVY